MYEHLIYKLQRKSSINRTGQVNDQVFRPPNPGPKVTDNYFPREQMDKVSQTYKNIDLRQAVKLPEGEDLNEWLARNVSDFYRQVSMLYSTITEFCTPEHCQFMSAGPGYRYRWSDDSCPSPIDLSAPQYITRLLNWTNSLLEDENIFPSALNAPFPDDFVDIVKIIMKRLFRFYAHCYYHHLDNFKSLNMEILLSTCFKHFILFAHEFNLIQPDQLEPLRDFIDQLLKT